MKRILTILITSILLVSLSGLVLADGERDATGSMHDDMIAAGGQNGTGIPGTQNGIGVGATTGTQNAGENSALENRVRAGNYLGEGGHQMMLQEMANNRIELQVGNMRAGTAMNIMSTQSGNATKLQVALSNGRNAEIKIMPDVAGEKALERLRLSVCSEENDCQMELREVGTGENVRLAYELKTQRASKVFGVFSARMNVEARVDAETGEVIQTNKPWWAFLASEPAE